MKRPKLKHLVRVVSRFRALGHVRPQQQAQSTDGTVERPKARKKGDKDPKPLTRVKVHKPRPFSLQPFEDNKENEIASTTAVLTPAGRQADPAAAATDDLPIYENPTGNSSSDQQQQPVVGTTVPKFAADSVIRNFGSNDAQPRQTFHFHLSSPSRHRRSRQGTSEPDITLGESVECHTPYHFLAADDDGASSLSEASIKSSTIITRATRPDGTVDHEALRELLRRQRSKYKERLRLERAKREALQELLLQLDEAKHQRRAVRRQRPATLPRAAPHSSDVAALSQQLAQYLHADDAASSTTAESKVAPSRPPLPRRHAPASAFPQTYIPAQVLRGAATVQQPEHGAYAVPWDDYRRQTVPNTRSADHQKHERYRRQITSDPEQQRPVRLSSSSSSLRSSARRVSNPYGASPERDVDPRCDTLQSNATHVIHRSEAAAGSLSEESLEPPANAKEPKHKKHSMSAESLDAPVRRNQFPPQDPHLPAAWFVHFSGSSSQRRRTYMTNGWRSLPAEAVPVADAPSLQSALINRRPEFVTHCLHRLDRIQAHSTVRHEREAVLRAMAEDVVVGRRPMPQVDILSAVVENAHMDGASESSRRETKRKYRQLPEYQEKLHTQKRKLDGATNRVRAEMYKQKILGSILRNKQIHRQRSAPAF